MDLKSLYQELIIDHGTSPRNFHDMPDCTCEAKGYNPLCGDKVHVFIKVDKSIISQISFKGNGCAISMASASIMTQELQNKTIDEAKDLFSKFQELVTNEKSAIELGRLSALAGVRQFPSRVKCATLAWHALQEALCQNGEK